MIIIVQSPSDNFNIKRGIVSHEIYVRYVCKDGEKHLFDSYIPWLNAYSHHGMSSALPDEHEDGAIVWECKLASIWTGRRALSYSLHMPHGKQLNRTADRRSSSVLPSGNVRYDFWLLGIIQNLYYHTLIN